MNKVLFNLNFRSVVDIQTNVLFHFGTISIVSCKKQNFILLIYAFNANWTIFLSKQLLVKADKKDKLSKREAEFLQYELPL